MSRLKRFAGFWWNFVVGDDWLVAVVVVFGLVVTFVLTHQADVDAWWLLPAVVIVLLPVSIRRLLSKSR